MLNDTSIEPAVSVGGILPPESAPTHDEVKPDGLAPLAESINCAYQSLRDCGRNTVQRAEELGRLLLVAKEKAGHGNWMKWLKENCPDLSPRSYEGYMRIAEYLDEHPDERDTIEAGTLEGALRYISISNSQALANSEEAGDAEEKANGGSTPINGEAAATNVLKFQRKAKRATRGSDRKEKIGTPEDRALGFWNSLWHLADEVKNNKEIPPLKEGRAVPKIDELIDALTQVLEYLDEEKTKILQGNA